MTHPPCPYTDAVLAQFLDGEAQLDERGRAHADALAHHHAGCERCRQALARARRLDALVAATAPVDLDDETVDGLLARVEDQVADCEADEVTVAVSAPGPMTSPTRRWGARILWSAAGFAAAWGLAFGFGSGDDSARQRAAKERHASGAPGVPAAESPAPRQAETQRDKTQRDKTQQGNGERASEGRVSEEPAVARVPEGPTPEEQAVARRRAWIAASGAVVLPDRPHLPASAGAASDRVDSEYDSSPEPARVGPGVSGTVLQRGAALRGLLLGLPAASARPAAVGTHAELLAGALRGASERRYREAASVVAGLAEGELLDATLQLVRGERRLATRLEQGLGRSATARTCAALLGDPGLDRLLRQRAAGDVEAAEAVARAAIRPARRVGRVALLLGLWGDLQARGFETGPAPSEARAASWFAPLPPPTTDALIAAAERSRKAPERRNCIVALAVRGDGGALGYLLSEMRGPRLETAYLAAYAISRMQPEVITSRLRAELRRSRRPELVLAAMASARSSLVEPWIAALDASEEEIAFLRAGGFAANQFAIATSLFRSRAGPAGSSDSF